MKTLYQLTEDMQLLLDLMLDDEMDPQTLYDTLEGLVGQIEDKADGYGAVIRQIETETAALRAEEKRMAARRQKLEARAAYMKDRIKSVMDVMGVRKLDGNLFHWSIQKNGGKLPVVVDDVEKVPERYLVIHKDIDRTAIAEYLEHAAAAHVEVPWARFGERGESLRLK